MEAPLSRTELLRERGSPDTGSSAPRRPGWWSTTTACALRSGAAGSARLLPLSTRPASAARPWQSRPALRWSTPACAPRIHAGPSRLASACVMGSSRASFTVIGDVPRSQRRSFSTHSSPRLLLPPRSGLVQARLLGQGAGAEGRSDGAAAGASARVAALRSGQVDWVEAPPPVALASLRQAGMQISSNVYPHVWPWHFSQIEGSP